jgi:hypothetical protein
MKRFSEIILTAALAAFMFGQVSAQENTTPASGNDQANHATVVKHDCGKFTDANNDGICDNAPAHTSDAKGASFVDANGDGICDHHADGTACQGKGNCNKENCQNNQNCQKGQHSGCGHANGTCEKQKQGCASQCPGHSSPDKK